MPERAVRVVISGRVQGVGFRAFIAREVARRQVVGWVRNRRNSTVEAVFIGEQDEVQDLVALCHDGPGPADVSEVSVTEYVGPALTRFTELPTE